MIPATTAMGELANAPHRNRKTSNAGQFGASAHARVQMVNMEKVLMMTIRLPYCSLSGPPMEKCVSAL